MGLAVLVRAPEVPGVTGHRTPWMKKPDTLPEESGHQELALKMGWHLEQQGSRRWHTLRV
jgi:hypothetical protein